MGNIILLENEVIIEMKGFMAFTILIEGMNSIDFLLYKAAFRYF